MHAPPGPAAARIALRTLALSAALAGAVFAVNQSTTGAPGTALAAQGAVGALGSGGTAKGDISTAAGDEDVVTADLVEGGTLTAKFSSKFAATVEFTGPDGAPLDLGWGTGTKRITKTFAVTSTGRHTFRIRSADGSQGAYSLSVSQKWPKKVALSGTTGDAVSWSMPAHSIVSGKVAAFPARSWDPTVDSIMGPTGDLLPGAIAGAKGLAKLPKITAGADGACAMTVTGGTPGGQFRAALVLKVPRAKPVSASIANGLTVISFAGDGVKQLLADNCVACHTWAGSAGAAKPHAKNALARVISGNMPQGGKQLVPAQVDLIRAWIATGMNP